jgi:hypothetical protein
MMGSYLGEWYENCVQCGNLMFLRDTAHQRLAGLCRPRGSGKPCSKKPKLDHPAGPGRRLEASEGEAMPGAWAMVSLMSGGECHPVSVGQPRLECAP